MTGQLGQAPDKGKNGSFLYKGSVSGQKVEFVQESSFNTTSFTVTAASRRNLIVNLTLYNDAGVILDFEEVLGVYNYLEVFVDTNLDYTYEYAIGSALSVGQQKITISPYRPRAGGNGSIRAIYHFENNDASDHTLYVESIWNYIEIE